jgi:hypothetical protein
MPQSIPRGIEVLVKKAAVDPAFKALLLDRRAAAAAEIGLDLSPSETLMLATVSRAQLETIIARTTVPAEHRRAFLGKAAAAMLATITIVASTAGCKGIRPDKWPPPPRKNDSEDSPERPADKTPTQKPSVVNQSVPERTEP